MTGGGSKLQDHYTKYDILCDLLSGFITLFISITMLCATDNILQNIPRIQTEYGNILHNIVSPT